MILAGALARYANGLCCINFTHLYRARIVTFLYIASFACIAIASMNTEIEFFFYLALFASVSIGIASNLSESVSLGFLKGFPTTLISDFGSGSGFAGLYASIYLLVMRSMGINDAFIFLS